MSDISVYTESVKSEPPLPNQLGWILKEVSGTSVETESSGFSDLGPEIFLQPGPLEPIVEVDEHSSECPNLSSSEALEKAKSKLKTVGFRTPTPEEVSSGEEAVSEEEEEILSKEESETGSRY